MLRPVRLAMEVRFDESGNVLIVAPWIFNRIHGPGETFIENYKEYLVVASSSVIGKHGALLVEHVVRLIADRSPKKPARIELPQRVAAILNVHKAIGLNPTIARRA